MHFRHYSDVIQGDLTFNGGVVGMNLNTQQFAIKGVTFNGTTTGVQITGCTDCTFVDCTFANAATGISASGDSGSLAVIDSTGISIGALVRGNTPSNGNNNVILENIVNSGVTFATSSGTVLSGDVKDTWVLGGVVSSLRFTPLSLH
jgi:glucan 1,3-beta-glucosidase